VIKTAPQIFLSFAAIDRLQADRVTMSLNAAGFAVVGFEDVTSGEVYNDAVRQAMGKSIAVVVPMASSLRGTVLPSGVLFEIGAAMGAGKPIYVIVEEDARATVPFSVPGMRVLPESRVDEIARMIRSDPA
jgi:hypothetical protein